MHTAVSGGVLIGRLFEEAGLPAGVLHVLPGDAEAGSALTLDPNVAMISFTGSTAAGREVGAAAGRTLKRVSLELGGNNALIVLDDADIDIAASAGAWSAFLHQGQICMTAGRHIVPRAWPTSTWSGWRNARASFPSVTRTPSRSPWGR